MSEDKEKTDPEASGKTENNEAEERAAKSPNRTRSLFTLRNGVIAVCCMGVFVFTLIVAGVIAFRTGTIDSYVNEQVTLAFDEMGIKMESGRFELGASPLKLYLENVKFTNKKTGQNIARIGNATLDMTVLDMLALSTIRHVSVDHATVNDFDIWVDFDENGKSNFDDIEITPPTNVVRLEYSASQVTLRDGRIHYGDDPRSLTGEAKKVRVFLKPATEREPDSEEASYLFEFDSERSTFTYDESKIEPVDIKAKGRFDEKGAEIDSLELKTPIGTSLLSGRLTNWKQLTYDLDIESTINLNQTSTILPMGTSIAGTGNFKGKVKGSGSKYNVEGEATSDSLAASNVRLKALKINGSGEGDGSIYKANGKAVAELLTFEDFRIDFPTMIGTIRGTGSDFRWLGELQAAALKSPLGTLGSLYISDAVAEYEDNRLLATLGNVKARKFSSESADLESIQTGNIRIVSRNGIVTADAPNVRAGKLNVDGATMTGVNVTAAKVRTENGTTTVTADRAAVDDYQSGDTKLKSMRASGVTVNNREGRTRVTASNIESETVLTEGSKSEGISASNVDIDYDGSETRIDSGTVRIAKVDTESAILGNLNIAGVRLTVREGTIEGSTADFEAGDIDLKKNGKLEKVSVRKPVFVLESSGRYRASLDMSLGGGVIGSVTLGEASASVTADNELVELESLTATVMDGKLEGEAQIALNESARSGINADFTDLDVSKLLALQGGKVVPLEGKTNGRAELTFRGTDFRRATGTVTAEVTANAGTADRGFIPVEGRLGAEASDGLFEIDYANLNTEKSTFAANGRFDLNGSDSDLTIALDSSDAAEIERIIRVLGVSPDLEQQLDTYEIDPRGVLAFNGRITGDIANPDLNGRGSIASLVVRSKDVGSIVAGVENTPDGFSVRNGKLQAREGGSVDFELDVPSFGTDNTELRATLNSIDLGNLIVVIPTDSIPERLRDVTGVATGSLNISGIPNSLSGNAELFTRNGSINGQSFENLASNAIFDGQLVRLTKFDASFGEGSLSGTGFYKTDTTEFKADLTANSIPASKILAFAPKSDSIPDVDGVIDMTANVNGFSDNTSSYDVSFEGSGKSISLNGSRFGTIGFNGKTESRVLNAVARTRLSGREQLITARLDFSDEQLPFKAESKLERSPVGPYLAIFRPTGPGAVNINGELTGEISVVGNLTAVNTQGVREFSWDNLRGFANLSAASFQFDDTPLVATEPVVISFDTSELVIENAKFEGGGSNLVVSGTKAFTDEGINNLAIDGKVNLGIVRAFSRNTLRNIFVNGVADVEVRLSGVNKTSRLNGTAVLENGSAATFVGSNRITFERLNGRVRFTTNQVQIEEVTAFLGGGKVTASGGALLSDNLSLDRIRLEIRGTNITVPLPDDFVTTGNANIEINGRKIGNTFGTFVAGTVRARRSVYRKDIDLAELISGRQNTGITQT
ncbi:MAG: hypothetical protein HKN33_11760, partial [Pyrinomonadaceae bacterium]|nr:hypothetical protein [Pyrinomonadaceae bacterium]